MRTRFLVLPALLAACGAAQAQALPDVLLKEFQRQSGVTGMAAAIVRDGRLAWHGEAGYADAARRQPVTQLTEFRLGSVSKFVTAAMLARLVDQGRIDLQRPVRAYLPDYPDKQHDFTPLQLATHTSGMAHYVSGDFSLDERPQPFKSVGEALSVFRDRPLAREPGTAFVYSSFGYNLLAAVMERAAKDDFLGMLSATARLAQVPSLQAERPAPVGANWSHLYAQDGSELPRGNITYVWAGGGMLANAPDIARFGLKTLDPAFIQPKTLALFSTPQRLTNGEAISQPGYQQGIGWRISTDYFGRPYYHHAGAIIGGRSQLSVYPGQNSAVSLLSNVMFTSAVSLTTESLFDAYSGSAANGKCREGTRDYTATFRGKPVAGTIRFSKEGAYCRADVSADNALGEGVARKGRRRSWLASAVRQTAPLYFVTPVGVFPGKAAGDTLSMQTSMGLIEFRLL